MAKLPRKLLKIFGIGSGATGITEFGSPASGSPVYTTDIDDIQTSDYEGGWASATLGGRRLPAFQDFNGIHYTLSNGMKYLYQEGIPEYLSTETYYQKSIVKKAGTYELYGSLIDDNVGNALPTQTDDANWTYLGELGNNEFDINSLPSGTPISTDEFAFNDASDGNTVKKAPLSSLVDTNQVAQAWVNFNGTGTVAIRDSYNVSSITDNGTGNYTANLSVTMGNTNFAIATGGSRGDPLGSNIGFDIVAGAASTTSVTILTPTASSGFSDWPFVYAVIFGDLA